MKRFFFALLVIALSLNLAGCIPITLDTDYEISQDVDQIQAIALFERTDESERLHDAPISEISTENFGAFVEELESIYAWSGFYLTIAAQDPSFAFAKKVIRIDYKDGCQEFISNLGYQEIRKNEEVVSSLHYSFNDDAWDAFLLKYFAVK
ncbi:MAG: hypothetical protein E7462_06810 [Ruminococcaceae bacterium]|nr:hypothetical protein [Oscillospiraceae bacterium]